MLLLGSIFQSQLWHLIPLLVSVCLVYGATRHELMGPILRNAIRCAGWIVTFMAVVFGLLVFVSWLV